MSKSARAEVKAEYWKIFDLDEGIEVGQQAVDEARRRIERFARQYEKEYPAAVKCLLTDVESLTVFLRFPKEHWPRIPHSNERTFGESRRRVKVIGRLPGERTCLSLVWAVLDRASRGWRGVTYTPATTRHLAELRRQLMDPPVSIAPQQQDQEVSPETVQPSPNLTNQELAFAVFYTAPGTPPPRSNTRSRPLAVVIPTQAHISPILPTCCGTTVSARDLGGTC